MTVPVTCTPITCTRRLRFSAGHRLLGYPRCQSLHGHNYNAFITVSYQPGGILAELPQDKGNPRAGMVVDLGEIKSRLGGWIDRHWDQGMILWSEDHRAIEAVNGLEQQKLFVLPWNPTAENIARYLLEVVGPAELRGLDVVIDEVRLEETENCAAIARRDGTRGPWEE